MIVHWKKNLIGKAHAFNFGEKPRHGAVDNSICGKHRAMYSKHVPKLLGDSLKPRCKLCERIASK